MDHQGLQQDWVEALVAAPLASFVTLSTTGSRVSTAGMLTVDETDSPVELAKDSVLTLRPDKLPESVLHLGMLNLTPLYLGALNVGWLLRFPAFNVSVGRNYVRIVRGRAALSPKDSPQLTAHLKSLVIMEVPDAMTLVLSNSRAFADKMRT